MKGVVFDLYSTLVESPGFSHVTRILFPGVLHAEISGIISENCESDDAAMITRLCEHFGVAMTNAQVESAVAQCTKWASERLFFPGTTETLKELRRRGFRLGLLSNTSQLLDATIEANGIPDLLDHLCLSHILGCRKPDIRTFQAIADKMQLSGPEMMMVGDILTVDIHGGAQIGMPGMQIAHPWEKQGSRTINSITELLDLPELQCPE